MFILVLMREFMIVAVALTDALLFRFGGFEFGVNNPLSHINFSLVAQDMQSLALASRLEQLMKINTTSAILNQENVTHLLGTFDNIKVRLRRNYLFIYFLIKLSTPFLLLPRSGLIIRPGRPRFPI